MVKTTVLTKPDKFGKVMILKEWFDKDKPYCAVCGKCSSRRCEHYGTREYGRCAQIHNTELEKE